MNRCMQYNVFGSKKETHLKCVCVCTRVSICLNNLVDTHYKPYHIISIKLHSPSYYTPTLWSIFIITDPLMKNLFLFFLILSKEKMSTTCHIPLVDESDE